MALNWDSGRDEDAQTGASAVSGMLEECKTPHADETTVYTDGACLGNPGPGGWAWAVPGGRWRSGAGGAHDQPADGDHRLRWKPLGRCRAASRS